jgi:hypothetical protein
VPEQFRAWYKIPDGASAAQFAFGIEHCKC